MIPAGEVSTPQTRTERQNATDGGAERARSTWSSLQWWPTLAGVGFAAFVALDMFTGSESGSDLGPIVAASGLVYLAAAALQKPSTAWPAFFVSVVIITAAKIGWTDFDATWILLALAALLVGYGLVTGAVRPAGGLPLQTIAMLGFGVVAAIALYLDEVVGAYIVAAGLLAHAAWDAYHHRANKVVARSLAEFCFVLDVLLAMAIVIVTMRG
jgi:hypothetical protein